MDGGILHLIKQWLKAPGISLDDRGVKKTVGRRQSQPQGHPARRGDFPAAGQLLPAPAGSALATAAPQRQTVLCRNDVEEPLKVVRRVLARLGLELNETRTHIVDATTASFNFLGFTLQMRRGAKTGKPYPNVRPADTSLKKIKARLTELTGRELTAMPLSDIVENVNRSLRGWANYFHHRNSSRAMSKVRTHAEDRLRTHLMKRHKIKDRGTGLRRFPHADLYERYGLYKVSTVAGWRSAHALA